MKGKKLILYLIVPSLIMGLFLAVFLSMAPLYIRPGSSDYKFVTYSDTQYAGGNSECLGELVNGRVFRLTYTLGDAIESPYAGFTIYNAPGNRYHALGNFDYVKVQIKSTVSRNLFLNFNVHSEDLELLDLDYPQLLLQHEIPIQQGRQEYTFPMRDFRTPLWWYELNHISAADAGTPDLDYTYEIEISNSNILLPNTRDTIYFYGLSFHYSRWKILGGGALLLGMYFFTLFFDQWRRKKKQGLVVSYKALDLESHRNKAFRAIAGFISENYDNEKLNLEILCSHTGLSHTKVSSVLKEELNLTFPQYLNSIRLAEARRLLVSTDLQITEIALAVGYNTITHFNRVFKEKTSQTPLQYRKSENKKNS